MTDQPVIEIVEVSKAYRVYRKLGDILKEGFLGGQRHDLFWALRGISFSVTEGERIGIVGPNGAGKSTLLKLITGNLSASSGHVRVNGRISALLSLIPALQKNDTGLENIKLNLLMTGVARKDIAAMVDDIVDFTELSSFIYQPVRTYSSGMQARLAFAVATAVTPEILIVDEVLGTGDAYFQGKAAARMRDLCVRGKALLFVSHATAALRNLCDRVIWLENGEIRMDSKADYVLTCYEEDAKHQEDLRTRSGNAEAAAVGRVEVNSNIDLFREGCLYVRIVAEEGLRLRDTHFVTSIGVTLGNDPERTLQLELVDMENPENRAALVVIGTEWGRSHTHNGRECRELSAKIGRTTGGVIVVRTGHEESGRNFEVLVRFESVSERGDETLGVEYFDAVEREWRRLAPQRPPEVLGGWTRHHFHGLVPVPPRDQFEISRLSYIQESLPAVTIGNVVIIADGNTVTSLLEGTPFDVHVNVKVNREVPLLDVVLKILRGDGVYVFWQSSGLNGGSHRDVNADLEVAFHFDPNFFGPGQYQVSATLGNGWDLESNFPHSQIFDRKINVAGFHVQRRHPLLEHGVLNVVVPVSIRNPPAAKDPQSESEANA